LFEPWTFHFDGGVALQVQRQLQIFLLPSTHGKVGVNFFLLHTGKGRIEREGNKLRLSRAAEAGI
jgi:hypothetical protein